MEDYLFKCEVLSKEYNAYKFNEILSVCRIDQDQEIQILLEK